MNKEEHGDCEGGRGEKRGRWITEKGAKCEDNEQLCRDVLGRRDFVM